jgi:hypothetical protein
VATVADIQGGEAALHSDIPHMIFQILDYTFQLKLMFHIKELKHFLK